MLVCHAACCLTVTVLPEASLGVGVSIQREGGNLVTEPIPTPVDGGARTRVQWFAVLVLDILGQKDLLSQWSTVPTTPDERSRFQHAVSRSVTTLRGLRKTFDNFYQSWESAPRVDPKSVYSQAADVDRHNRVTRSSYKSQQFSDTFAFFSPLVDAGGMPRVAAIDRLLLAGCVAMITSLSAGCPMRGGFSVGLGTEIENGYFYGPALARAHHLESCVAKYPRIVAGPEVRTFLESGMQFAEDRRTEMVLEAMATECKLLIGTDEDGHPIVDYLGKRAADLLSEVDGSTRECVAQARTWVDREAARLATNTTLGPRYRQLGSYFARNIGYWISPACG